MTEYEAEPIILLCDKLPQSTLLLDELIGGWKKQNMKQNLLWPAVEAVSKTTIASCGPPPWGGLQAVANVSHK